MSLFFFCYCVGGHTKNCTITANYYLTCTSLRRAGLIILVSNTIQSLWQAGIYPRLKWNSRIRNEFGVKTIITSTLFPAHTHLHTHKKKYTHKHTYAHTYTRKHTQTHTYTHAHTGANTQTLTHVHARTLTHLQTHTHTYAHTHTHLYACAQTHTHRHTHAQTYTDLWFQESLVL